MKAEPKPLTLEQVQRRHKSALLLVTFGSTYPGPHQTFARIKAHFAERFPDRDIYMAFTSGMCMKRWFEKSGEQYYPADAWLSVLGEAGYERISIQSLHVIPGLEYSFIKNRYLPKFHQHYPHIPTVVGEPLLYDEADVRRVGDIIYGKFASRLQAGEGLVMMGHGNSTDKFPEANGKYDELNAYLQSLDEKIVIGTVDYESRSYEDVESYLVEHCPAPAVVNFLPLMSVAGDHALNDMAGEWQDDEPLEEQSWLQRIQHAGYSSTLEEHCHLYGLADLADIRAIWLQHLAEAERYQPQAQA